VKQSSTVVINSINQSLLRQKAAHAETHNKNKHKLRVGFLPWQNIFLPGQWKKPVKTGNNWQKVQYINWILPITDININGHINDVDIANDFAAHFKRVFNSSGDDVDYSEFMRRRADDISDDVQSSFECIDKVTVDLISTMA